MVEKRVIDLGCILKMFPNFKFDMESTSGRQRLQKFIYLLQAHDVYLGYPFVWNVKGPYSPILSACGFALTDGVNARIPENGSCRFASDLIQKRFKEFKKFIKGRENDAEFLEIAATAHYLVTADGFKEDDAAWAAVKQVGGIDYGMPRCADIISDMKKRCLVGLG